MEAGDAAAATVHFQRALALRPESVEVLELLFANAQGQISARRLWAFELWNATCDEKGQARGKKEVIEELLRVAPGAETISRARVAAARELAKLCAAERKKAIKIPAAGVVADWLAELALEVARPLPVLFASLKRELDFEYTASRRLSDAVIKDLKRAHSRSTSQGDHSSAIRAARILRGLAAQGSFAELQGPVPPGMDAISAWAVDALGKSRAAWLRNAGAPLTVDQLLAMEEEEIREFSRTHADQSSPGLAVSPEALYRIESSCGYETLLGMAETVERHHERLVKWYGTDPFEGRQGLVRVVPEAAGLESEGAGFWWVGGFQGGDTTTLRFSCGTIEGLGHTLVHELTHRFDGAIYPGSPAWLAEGKAVWTGGSYEGTYKDHFIEKHISFGTVENAWGKGYGGEGKLRQLLEGEVEDYRDNYVAGYALYVYLKLWLDEAGVEPYSGQMESYMRGLRQQKPGSAVEWFTENFADGAGGRPEDFPAFAVAFQEFLRGFYWEDRAEWTANYIPSIERAGSGWVYDAQTWTWSRNRAEPFWGQDQAWRAGELFLELGQEKEAAKAFLWAWSVDEHTPGHVHELARVLEATGKDTAAWVLRNAVVRNRMTRAGEGDEAPLRLPKTLELLGALTAEAQLEQESGDILGPAAFAADQRQLAAWLGQPAIAAPHSPSVATSLHPWDEPAEQLGLGGWTEDGLTGFEERRKQGCWYAEEDGDLHVGRSKPRDASGALDRQSHYRDSFALSEREMAPGRYEMRCNIQFTTSYVSGALILGYQRRDRHVRLSLSAGDYYYSIGKKDEGEEIKGVSWGVGGLRTRDPALSGSVRNGRVEFETARTSFELKVIVDGPAAHFWIEGKYLGAYHDPLGTPISGAIGFATGRGAVRISDLTVQRLDRSRQVGRALSEEGAEVLVEAGLDLHAPTEGSFMGLVGRPVLGMVPSPSGTILVWVAVPNFDPEKTEKSYRKCISRAVKLAQGAHDALFQAGVNQQVLFLLPDVLGEELMAELTPQLAESMEEYSWSTQIYPWQPPSEDFEDLLSAKHRSWLIFVDSAGVLRFCDRFYGLSETFDEKLAHWLIVFRDNVGQR
ncbi:MAG: hypothetical protein ACI8PQ_001431 [Planctomycetota bacterium]|jgi:hypothetical protein